MEPVAVLHIKSTKKPQDIKKELDDYFGEPILYHDYNIISPNVYQYEVIGTTPKLIQFVNETPDDLNFYPVLDYLISVNTIWEDEWNLDIERKKK
jgi:hypothetical protein